LKTSFILSLVFVTFSFTAHASLFEDMGESQTPQQGTVRGKVVAMELGTSATHFTLETDGPDKEKIEFTLCSTQTRPGGSEPQDAAHHSARYDLVRQSLDSHSVIEVGQKSVWDSCAGVIRVASH
jgi:hypothetical protein